MAVTRFDSVVAIQTVGTADVDKLAASFDKLSGSIDKVNEKSKAVKPPDFSDFAAKVKQGIQDPLGAAGDAAEALLNKLGPMGAGFAAGAAAVGAYAKVALDSARSLGQLGDKIQDTSVRLGLSTRETQQFSLAMKIVGGDISGLEGIMRKLSQGLADNSTEGKAAREGLRDLGIEYLDAQGKALPMSGVIVQLSQRLGAMTDTAERNTAAVKVMGRGALEVLPDLLDLAGALDKAKGGSFFSDKDLAHFQRMQAEVALVDQKWDFLVAKLKEGIVIPIEFIAKGMNSLPGQLANLPLNVIRDVLSGNTPSPGGDLGGFALGASQTISGRQAQVGAAGGLRSFLSTGLDNARDKLERLKSKFDEARVAAGKLAEMKAVDPDEAAKARAEVEATAAAYKKQSDLVKELEKDESARLANLEKARDLTRKGIPFYKIGEGQDAVFITREQLAAANPIPRGQPSLFSPLQNPFSQVQFAQNALQNLQPGLQVVNGQVTFVSPQAARTGPSFLNNVYQPGPGDIGRQLQFAQDLQRKTAQDRLTALNAELQATARIVELRAGPGGEIETARDVRAIRQQAIEAEFNAVHDLESYQQQTRQNELDFQVRLAEIQKQRLDSYREAAGRLFDDLISGKGISSFIRTEITGIGRQIFENLAAETYKSVAGSVPKLGGGGGLLGRIFAGTPFGADQSKVAMDLNTAATNVNTQALLSAARVFSLSPSGGGGGRIGQIGNVSGDLLSYLRNPQPGMDWYNNTPGDVPYYHAPIPTTLDGEGAADAAETAGTSRGLFTAGNIAKAGGVAAAGFGVYSGIKQGGGRGAVTAIGSAAAGAAILDPEPISKAVLAGVALASSVVTSLFGDPKQQRQQQISDWLQQHRFEGPAPVSITQDIYGRDLSYDFRGNLRPSGGAAMTINYTVQAMDSQDVAKFFEVHAAELNRGVAKSVTAGGDLVPTMATALNLA